MFVKKGGITDDPAESTLQFTDIELYFFCDQVDDIQKIIVVSTFSSSAFFEGSLLVFHSQAV